MARPKGSKNKHPRRKKVDLNEIARMREIISGLDKEMHSAAKEIKRMHEVLRDRDSQIARLTEEKQQRIRQDNATESIFRENFDLAITVMNATRHTIKQLARQCDKEKNHVMAAVFEYLYQDMANLAKYKRLTQREAAGVADQPEEVKPIDFSDKAWHETIDEINARRGS